MSTQLLPPGWCGCGNGESQDGHHPLPSQFPSIPDADKLNHRYLLGRGAPPRSCTGSFPSDQYILGWVRRWGMGFRGPPPSLALNRGPIPSPTESSMHQTPGQIRPPHLSMWGIAGVEDTFRAPSPVCLISSNILCLLLWPYQILPLGLWPDCPSCLDLPLLSLLHWTHFFSLFSSDSPSDKLTFLETYHNRPLILGSFSPAGGTL